MIAQHPNRSTPVGFVFLAFTMAFMVAVSGVSVYAEGRDELIKARIEATAPGVDAAARDTAIARAKRDLVVRLLQTELAAKDLSALEPILDQADGYIQATQLGRHETAQNTTEVEIECYVKRKQILQDTAAFLFPRMAPPPSVFVVIAERIGAGSLLSVAQPGTAENALIERLREQGFEIVDSALIRACCTESDLIRAAQGDVPVAAALAQKSFADIAVFGEAISEAIAEKVGSNVLASKAKVTLRVLRAADGALAEAMARDARVHSVDALDGAQAAFKDACAKLTKDVTTAAVLSVLSAVRRDGITTVTIEAPGNRSRFDLLVEALRRETAGVPIEELFFSETLARVRVSYAGSLGALMKTLTGGLYEGLALDLVKAVEGTIVIRFVSP